VAVSMCSSIVGPLGRLNMAFAVCHTDRQAATLSARRPADRPPWQMPAAARSATITVSRCRVVSYITAPHLARRLLSDPLPTG
jgi:hypothetical protein